MSKVKKLVEAYSRYAPTDLHKLEESYREEFKDSRFLNTFELGDLFIECFGFDRYREAKAAGRENGSSVARRIMESSGGSITTAAFANITQQYAYSTVLEAYNLPEAKFADLIPVVPTKLQKERIPGITAIGDEAQVVGENEEYPKAAVGENWVDTPLVRKRGFVVEASWEAMFFDRTNQLTQQLQQQAQWMKVNHEKRAIRCIVDAGETTSIEYRYRWRGLGTIATYGDNSGTHNWDNLSASNALLDWTSIQTAWLLLMAMTDPFTGEPIMVEAKHLLIPPALVAAAAFALGGNVSRAVPGYATTGNPSKTEIPSPVNLFGNMQPVTSQLFRSVSGSDSTWFIGDVSKAFRYMQALPLEVTTAPGGNEAEFSRDCVWRTKVREVGTFATVEPRAVIKCTG